MTQSLQWVDVVAIEPDGEEECVCIAVSHPSRLYITEGGIVTHNTTVDRDTGLNTSRNGVTELTFEDIPIASMNADTRADIDAYNDSLREDARRNGLSPAVVTARQLQLGNERGARGAASSRFANALQSLFKKRIVFVRPVQGVVSDGANIRSRSNALFVNTESDQPLLYLTGHEFGHSLEAQNKTLYDQLSAVVLADASNRDDYNERLAAWGYDKASFDREFVNDFIGSQWMEPDFWKGLESSQAGMFSRIASAAVEFLDGLIRKIGAYPRDVRGYFPDISRARAALLKAMEQHQASGQFPEKGELMDVNDAQLVQASRTAPMRLVSARMSEVSGELRAKMREHKATADERTIDGERIEEAGYLVRKDADMMALADQWIDGFIEQEGAAGRTAAESRETLEQAITSNGKVGGEVLDVDTASVILGRIIEGRHFDLGLERSQVEAWAQRVFSQAGYALRQARNIWDPLTKLVESADEKGGAEMAKVFGVNVPVNDKGQPDPAAVGAQVYDSLRTEVEAEMKAEMDKAIKDLGKELEQAKKERSADVARLTKELNELRQKLAESLTEESELAADSSLTSMEQQLQASKAETAEARKATGFLQRALDLWKNAGRKRAGAMASLKERAAQMRAEALKKMGVDSGKKGAFDSSNVSLRSTPSPSEDLYLRTAFQDFERSVRQRSGALRAFKDAAGVEIREVVGPDAGQMRGRASVSITDRGDITISIREDFARATWARVKGNAALGINDASAIFQEEQIHAANLLVWRDDWIASGKATPDFRDYVAQRAASLLLDVQSSVAVLKGNAAIKAKDGIHAAWVAYFGAQEGVTPENILDQLTDPVAVQRIATGPATFVLELTRQLVQFKRSGVTTETVADRIIAPLLDLGRRILAKLREVLGMVQSGALGKELSSLIPRIEAALEGSNQPFTPQGETTGEVSFLAAEPINPAAVDLGVSFMLEGTIDFDQWSAEMGKLGIDSGLSSLHAQASERYFAEVESAIATTPEPKAKATSRKGDMPQALIDATARAKDLQAKVDDLERKLAAIDPAALRALEKRAETAENERDRKSGEVIRLKSDVARLTNLNKLADTRIAELEALPRDSVQANEQLAQALLQAKERSSQLRRELREVQEALAEETARANQEREVGIAIGKEEGRAQAEAEAASRQPEPQLERFELWLMGETFAEGLQGMPTLEQVARKFIDGSRWDAARFSAFVGQMFPALDPHILADAVDRISAMMVNRSAAAQRQAIRKLLDQLAKRKDSLRKDSRFSRFFEYLDKAAKLGVLDERLFVDAFAASWGLNGLTPAIVADLRTQWQAIQASDATGMVRETAERKFIEAVNRVAPSQSWLNFIFSNYQSRVLSSFSSMVNQFSAVGRLLVGMSAIQRTWQAGLGLRPDVVLSEWLADVGGLLGNLPLMLTALRGESLGHLPGELAHGHVPNEQRTGLLTGNDRLRVGGWQASRGMTQVAKIVELWTWRTIRAAEGLTGITDAEGHFRLALINHYRQAGMSAAAARAQAVADIASNPAERAAAEAQARQEQAAGEIGRGQAVIRRRIAEIIAANVDQRNGSKALERQGQLTGHAQFKTLPTGLPGFWVSQAMGALAPGNRGVARFWLLFGRFLGHTVDVTLGYMPIAHLANKAVMKGSKQEQVILETFGSVEAYQRMVDARAVSASAFLLGTGALAALATALRDDEEEEPFFAITGSAPDNDRDVKDALAATGKWGEQQIRIGGVPVLNYGQLPELAPALGVLGNLLDSMRFSRVLHQRGARDGDVDDGKRQAELSTIGVAIGKDYIMTPIKRSTYRQWFEVLTGSMTSTSTGQTESWLQKLGGIVTKPIEGMTRIPVIVDVDKILKKAEGGRQPDGLAESVLRRLPFAESLGKVGTETFNAYGERTPAWDIISALPTSPDFSAAATAAARLNVETGTRRGLPGEPTLPDYANGTKREPTAAEMSRYYAASGRLFTESLLRNEADIRRAYRENGQAVAAKIVANISKKANATAKEEVWEVEAEK